MRSLYEAFPHARRVNREKGFTLIELLVVIAIIAILAAIAIPQFVRYQQTAKKGAAKENCVSAKKVIARYFEVEAREALGEVVTYPTASQLIADDLGAANATSPLDRSVPAFAVGDIGNFSYTSGVGCSYSQSIPPGQVVIAADPTTKRYAVACEYTGDGQVDEATCFGNW